MLGSIKREYILGREIFIYLPPSYKSSKDKRFPVLYGNDGAELYKYSERLINSFEEGFKEGRLNEFIWIGIYSEKRIHEYTPWPAPALVSKFDNFGGEGKGYIEFVVNEIKTYIDSNYNTKTDAKNTWIMGYSLGGLISVYSVYVTNAFGKIASICGSFWYKDMVKWIEENDMLNRDFQLYIHYGKKEGEGKKTLQRDAVMCVEKVIEIFRDKLSYTEELKISNDDGGHHHYVEERYINAIYWLANK